jgi:hypothetical protein
LPVDPNNPGRRRSVVVGWWENFVVVLNVLLEAQPDLLLVGHASCLTSLLAGVTEHGEQNRRQNGNYRYHHEQLDEGETDAG